MSARRGPLFLEREGYRQRRLADAARLLPICGGVLMFIPLLWPRAGDAEPQAMSRAMIYLFGCWLLLILGAQLLSRRLDSPPPPPSPGAGSGARTGTGTSTGPDTGPDTGAQGGEGG